jgi:hypothetical protein
MTSFDDLMRQSVLAACHEWGYPAPDDSWYEKLNKRLPSGLRFLFERGLDSGLLRMVDGFRFTMRDLPKGKGPYVLYSKSTSTQVPAPNWEYLVQAVDYVRVHENLAPKGYVIGVEDKLMDVTVRDPRRELLWYIESKEKRTDLTKLVADIRNWGIRGVDLEIDDRGKDGLRKAKYLILNRPPYFSGSAIGIRLDFAVSYRGTDRFDLIEDAVPIV